MNGAIRNVWKIPNKLIPITLDSLIEDTAVEQT